MGAISTEQKLLFIFEGRDAAHKTGTIKILKEHLNPQYFRVTQLGIPSDFVKSQWYFQRYVPHLPGAGGIVFFDRSWYNRAGVEHVMEFCTNEQYQQFLEQVIVFEKMLIDSGIRIFKLYFSITKDEQKERLKNRAENPLKRWKLSEIDKVSQEKWQLYSEAKEKMFLSTNTDYAPWSIIKSSNKKIARLNVMRYFLSNLEYDHKDPKVAVEPDPSYFSMAKDVYS